MLSTFLQLSGHQASGALSRSQTLDKLAYEQPDAVLLDIMLPDGNGLEICRELRAKDAWKNLPIIIISAHAPPMIAEAEAAGANSYLAKPINLSKLQAALRDAGVS
jgi:DNA-binding response OmpR family regulator